MHVHVTHTDGEAKFWLEPQVELAMNQGFSKKQIDEASSLVHDHYEEITHAGVTTSTPEAAKSVSLVMILTGAICLSITPMILEFSINPSTWTALFGLVWGVFYLGISWAKRKNA